MNVPDYVSPIVAARLWRWDGARIISLNGASWAPRRPFRAECRDVHGRHRAPELYCRCGVYAAKNLNVLQGMFGVGGRMFPWNGGFIFGEVYLWGVVVEHELGWRAQFAYPKSLVLPIRMMLTHEHIQKFCSDKLIPYGVDLYFANGDELIPLWSKSRGYQSEGFVLAKKHAS